MRARSCCWIEVHRGRFVAGLAQGFYSAQDGTRQNSALAESTRLPRFGKRTLARARVRCPLQLPEVGWRAKSWGARVAPPGPGPPSSSSINTNVARWAGSTVTHKFSRPFPRTPMPKLVPRHQDFAPARLCSSSNFFCGSWATMTTGNPLFASLCVLGTQWSRDISLLARHYRRRPQIALLGPHTGFFQGRCCI